MLTRRDLLSLFGIILLLIGIPIAVYLIRTQQILRSRATITPIVFTGPNVKTVTDASGSSKLIATKQDIELQLTSTLDTLATPTPSSTANPSSSATSNPTSNPTINPTTNPTSTPVVCNLGNGGNECPLPAGVSYPNGTATCDSSNRVTFSWSQMNFPGKTVQSYEVRINAAPANWGPDTTTPANQAPTNIDPNIGPDRSISVPASQTSLVVQMTAGQGVDWVARPYFTDGTKMNPDSPTSWGHWGGWDCSGGGTSETPVNDNGTIQTSGTGTGSTREIGTYGREDKSLVANKTFKFSYDGSAHIYAAVIDPSGNWASGPFEKGQNIGVVSGNYLQLITDSPSSQSWTNLHLTQVTFTRSAQ